MGRKPGMTHDRMCPCCNEHRFKEMNCYEDCPVCGWLDDVVQRLDHDYKGGANKLSLNAYKEKWENESSLVIV